MELLKIVRESWGFTGLVPARILDTNAFGNVLVEDVRGQLWRICPEELSCEHVGTSMDELQALRSSTDWTMERLVVLATASLGTPAEGRCFCLKIPAVLGGKYEVENLGTIAVPELIAFSGDVASQIEGLPDGAQVEFKIVD